MYFLVICIVFMITGGAKGFDYTDEELEHLHHVVQDNQNHHDTEVALVAPAQPQKVSNSLSLSKYWAMQFDEELGRGETMTNDKKIELEDNMIRMAEILHFIPEGAVAREHEHHIDYILNLHHPNPHTHILRDPYGPDLWELEGPSSQIANNELGENEKRMELSETSADAETPQTYPHVRAIHPRFALHGI